MAAVDEEAKAIVTKGKTLQRPNEVDKDCPAEEAAVSNALSHWLRSAVCWMAEIRLERGKLAMQTNIKQTTTTTTTITTITTIIIISRTTRAIPFPFKCMCVGMAIGWPGYERARSHAWEWEGIEDLCN